MFIGPLFLFLLIFLYNIDQINGVYYCCSGTSNTNKDIPTLLEMTLCPKGFRDYCLKVDFSPYTFYNCSAEAYCSLAGVTCCSTDNCNCPSDGTVHKSLANLSQSFGDLRKIMYPVIGVVFGLFYIIFAFMNCLHPVIIALIILLDILFGIFLIFLPTTVYLGLLHIALGMLIILCQNLNFTLFPILSSFVVFLYTGGLTFLSGMNFVDRISNSAILCESRMNLVNLDNSYWNLDTRCENYSLFVAFCVFVLFVIQPLYILAAFGNSGPTVQGTFSDLYYRANPNDQKGGVK